MIFALEGPDCCGKTTLFHALKERYMHPANVTWVPRLPLPDSLFPVIRDVDVRQEAIWRVLYDPARTYICDRHFSVSGIVYNELYGREPVDMSWWIPSVRVVYLRVPLHELQARHKVTHANETHFDAENYQRCIDLYDQHVLKFKYATFCQPLDQLVDLVRRYIRAECGL